MADAKRGEIFKRRLRENYARELRNNNFAMMSASDLLVGYMRSSMAS